MRTACSSSRGGGGPDPPEFSPWVWAWIWSPSISSLGVGLDLIPLNFPLGVSLEHTFRSRHCPPGPEPPEQAPPGTRPPTVGTPWEQATPQSRHPSCEQNDKQVQKYYLAPTSFAGGNKFNQVNLSITSSDQQIDTTEKNPWTKNHNIAWQKKTYSLNIKTPLMIIFSNHLLVVRQDSTNPHFNTLLDCYRYRCFVVKKNDPQTEYVTPDGPATVCEWITFTCKVVYMSALLIGRKSDKVFCQG